LNRQTLKDGILSAKASKAKTDRIYETVQNQIVNYKRTNVCFFVLGTDSEIKS